MASRAAPNKARVGFRVYRVKAIKATGGVDTGGVDNPAFAR